jgi:predicted O-linked N-acetylglucosamine transferase (SPINDLY family)
MHPYADFLAGLAEADLILDTPGFSGGGTSLDALGAGAAVLCFEGEHARARQTSAMLRMIGVEASIARDPDDYATRAATLLADPALRRELRERIAAGVHVLFDDARPVEGFADFLRRATQGP